MSFFLLGTQFMLHLHAMQRQETMMTGPEVGDQVFSTERENRMLVRTSLQNRQMTVPDLAASWSAAGVTASKTTVRR